MSTLDGAAGVRGEAVGSGCGTRFSWAGDGGVSSASGSDNGSLPCAMRCERRGFLLEAGEAGDEGFTNTREKMSAMGGMRVENSSEVVLVVVGWGGSVIGG